MELLMGPVFTTYSISLSLFAIFVVQHFIFSIRTFFIRPIDNAEFNLYYFQHDFPSGYGLIFGNYVVLIIFCYLGEELNQTVSLNQ